ncbi:rod shape-determining protein RodA [Sinomicrobium weinanense]|uniref:Rod shape-determining protein RodA n=1 Tax=Sinomicrobium weinanense TaxID=2842200 RepID=A0A926JUR7_9FLAO|nr:rod shape-determining protein RodA [Sinomicrobium weinanense]MBC9797731.1 rod shape-determining protein RodA [Sinomicrobium weinanense]MBU3123622.1 rod shape-determining protein RodA [Sinomicrobium weinanense]
MNNSFVRKIDWLTVILYFLLVFIGWVNIYSSSITDNTGASVFDFSQFYGKQLTFIGLSTIFIVLILAIDAKFYQRFSGIIYLISIASLAGIFIFGKTIAGQTAWYDFGFFSIQPGEFAKTATALALAEYLSDSQTNIKYRKYQLKAFLIIGAPIFFILLQPDPGSAMVFLAFIFVMYREGLPSTYLWAGLGLIILFVSTLIFGALWVCVAVFLFITLYYLWRKRKKKMVSVLPLITLLIITAIVSSSVRFTFDNVFKQHHRDRINLWLKLEHDPNRLSEIRRSIGYNTYQSESAISSGGFSGKGFLQGTRTKGGFVPEQHTDYIFSTVGEEWGFVGSTIVILLFIFLLLRLLFLSERQKSKFSRVYGYSVAAILFFHFTINIGMVIGLLPTVGIPLPFFSYGGSGLWAFTLLLFVFIKLDANQINEWEDLHEFHH